MCCWIAESFFISIAKWQQQFAIAFFWLGFDPKCFLFVGSGTPSSTIHFTRVPAKWHLNPADGFIIIVNLNRQSDRPRYGKRVAVGGVACVRAIPPNNKNSSTKLTDVDVSATDTSAPIRRRIYDYVSDADNKMHSYLRESPRQYLILVREPMADRAQLVVK